MYGFPAFARFVLFHLWFFIKFFGFGMEADYCCAELHPYGGSK
jgi:hypothetical protein